MEGREGREPLSRDDPRHQEALEKVGEIMAKFFDPKRTDGGFALRSIVSQARHLAASIYSTGFQPILPFRGVRTFSNVDDGAMARKLDFFRRFEAGELTVAYTDEWSRLVNTPSSESEPATDEDGGSTDEEDGESEED